MNEFFKKNYHILAYILLYSSVIIAFFFNENVTSGPYHDLQYTLKQVKIFEKDFLYSFLNYDKIESPNRLSPVYIATLVLFKKIFINFDLARFFLMHVLIISQLYFYKCLRIIYFRKFSVDKKILFLLSCIIFLSPSFRANIIWVESSMFGLLLFLVSLYYFLKNQKLFKKKNVYLNIFFLALAAYLRPSYSLFALYFFYIFIKYYKEKISIYSITLMNFALAFPAIYYVFVLGVFFISFGGLSLNYSDKIGIISSIIFFHIIPFIYFKKNIFDKDYTAIIFSLLASLLIIYFFRYDLSQAGGGFFLHLSKFLFKNNYFFYLLLPLFIFVILKFAKINFTNNIILIIILFMITPQYHIFHKYYDPLVFILFLTIFDLKFEKNLFFNNKFLVISYLFFLFHYSISFINTYYINF